MTPYSPITAFAPDNVVVALEHVVDKVKRGRPKKMWTLLLPL